MKEIIFVIGGCRSGKSRHALELAERTEARQRFYVATCIPHDDEMKQRVNRHQEERSNSWVTVEEPVRLPEAIETHARPGNLLLVDCLTLWINNLMMQTDNLDDIMGHVSRLVQSLEQASSPVILVSNEVGAGIVPENRLARLFRDAAGFANQNVAACADRVIWTVAGIPVTIKDKE